MSKVTTIIDNEYVCLWYHPDAKIVHHQIRKFPPSEIFREMLSTGAELLENHHAKKWLSDDRGNTVVRKEDNLWGDMVWWPRVMNAGFKYWAVVVPDNTVGQLQMKRFIHENEVRGVTIRTYATEEEALAWLGSVD